jgi:hypothetical protein
VRAARRRALNTGMRIEPMTPAYAAEVVTWRYPPP